MLLLTLFVAISAAAVARGGGSICETPSLGVFAYIGSPALSGALGADNNVDYLLNCVSNIAVARSMMTNPFILSTKIPNVQERPLPYCVKDNNQFRLDVYLGFGAEASEKMQADIRDSLSNISGVQNVFMTGADRDSPTRTFFQQLREAAKVSAHYDYSLKIHTTADRRVMKHSVECLCGTPSQVISILNVFGTHQDVGIVAAQGLTVSRKTSLDHVAPFLMSSGGEREFKDNLDNRIRTATAELQSLCKAIFGKVLNPLAEIASIEGQIYWTHMKPLSADAINNIVKELLVADIAIRNNAINKDDSLPAFDLLLPAAAAERGHRIVAMIPAPKILPIYFPQYHSIPENDKFWSPGFTEWTLLRPMDLPKITKPLDISQGGLGYYNLTDRDIRARQGVLNKHYGGHGFVFYHYWFSGPGAPDDHKVLYKIPELMLLDGEPYMPFMFSWANEPWTRRWTGKTKDTMLPQDYGGEQEWIEHFKYLLQFFKHKNYIKINGKPVFVIYRFEHMGRRLQPMLKLWNRLAKENGFVSGLYIIATIGNFFNQFSEKKVLSIPEINALFQFWPMLTANFPDSTYGVDINVTIPQYWGSFTGFDPRPRRPTIARRYDINPAIFENSLRAVSNCSDVKRWRELEDNFIFVTAFNEWNEQAVLEPNTLHGNGFLSAMRYALQTVPSCQV